MQTGFFRSGRIISMRSYLALHEVKKLQVGFGGL